MTASCAPRRRCCVIASQQQVRLVANLPSDERDMAQYAESPVMGLQAGGQSIASQQDALITSGMLIGMDWRAKLVEYNQSGGKAALSTVVPVTATAAAVEPVAASALEDSCSNSSSRPTPRFASALSAGPCRDFKLRLVAVTWVLSSCIAPTLRQRGLHV